MDDPKRWNPFRELEREVDRLLDGFEPLHSWNWRLPRVFPALNVHDAGEYYLITVESPGVVVDELELSMTGESLTLRGERKRTERIAEESFRRQERPVGRWSRTMTLPESVDSDAATAEFSNGILTIKLPKIDDPKPRQIVVQNRPG